MHYVSTLVSSTRPQEKTVNNAHHISVCDVMRDNTNEVIMKIEGLLPSYIENVTDLQAEGLRITRDFFGTCYIAEKELLDKMGVDQKVIEVFDKYSKVITKTAVSEIEMANNFQRTWVDNIMASMKSYDDYVKVMISSYAKMLEYMSSMIPKRS
jgi:hypothetical protein